MTVATVCILLGKGKLLWVPFDAVLGTNSVSSDGNIRYFEYENDKFEFLSEYKSADPQRGIAFLPKRGVNVSDWRERCLIDCANADILCARFTKTRS